MAVFYEKKIENLVLNYGNSLDFPPHLHDHIEIVYMLQGETITYVDGNKSIFKKGDLFISFPNQIHQYSSIGFEEYLILIFSPKLLEEFSYVFKSYIPKTQIIQAIDKQPHLLHLLTSIAEVYKSDCHFKEIKIKGYLLVFFSEIIDSMELTSIKTSNLSTLQNILIYCSKNYNQDISLESVSRSLHISKYYISHLLKSKINMGFSDYINSLRISEACKHLSSKDMTITEIAYLVGFNTIRSFNRAFIKQMGVTPTDFRKEPSYYSDTHIFK